MEAPMKPTESPLSSPSKINGVQEASEIPDAPTLAETLQNIPQPDGEREESPAEPGTDASISPAGEGRQCEVRRLYEGAPKCNCCINWVEEYPDDVKSSTEEERESKKYAIVVRMRKDHDSAKPLELHSIVIQSPHLKRLLGEVFDGFGGITTTLKKLVFMSPFYGFYYRWDRFNELVDQQTEQEPLAHVKLLQNTLYTELKDEITTAKDLLDQGVTTFTHLWTLFQPGALVYSFVEDCDRIYYLLSMEYTTKYLHKVFSLNLQYVDWNGLEFGFATTKISISDFSGTKSITDLTHYPLKYHSNVDELTTRLRARGRKFQSLRGSHYKSYQGLVTFFNAIDLSRETVDSRIMIDSEEYLLSDPQDCAPLLPLGDQSIVPQLNVGEVTNNNLHANFDDEMPPLYDSYGRHLRTNYSRMVKAPRSYEEVTELTDEQLLLCNPLVRGLSLSTKRWSRFLIDKVEDVPWNQDAFETLVLPSDYKALILSFIDSQLRNGALFDDIVKGKGRNMIFLLAGNPGTGKTLTAEAVAEKLKRPLYSISGEELGDSPRIVEEKLKKIFAVAEKWNAVLLLDECDVFLEERSTKDLARNSYVAVFLRNLEYYKGILFMTTNRPSSIDSAFQSRIHFTICYPALDSKARKLIWKGLVERSRHDSALTAGDFKRLSQIDMNGRDIKNTLKTAQLLAVSDEAPLDMRHLQTVLRVKYDNGFGHTGTLWSNFSYLFQLVVRLLSFIAEFLHLSV